MKDDIAERLRFAHVCTGDQLYAEALAEIEKRDFYIDKLNNKLLAAKDEINGLKTELHYARPRGAKQ